MEKLLAILKTALDRIRSNLLEKEADVKQAIVSPILRALDWDDSNPAECKCEYPVPGGSVDYALIRSNDNIPLVFIETKRLGGLGAQGEDQLLGYAFKAGVPLLILTDGNIWDFYISMMEGAPNDRRFYHAELEREENISDYAQYFTDYLRKDRVVSGQARQLATQRHKSNQEKSKTRGAIPGVWQDVLTAKDEETHDLLLDLLVGAVESKCGTKPELDDVKAFLSQIDSSANRAHTAFGTSSPPPAIRSPASPTSFGSPTVDLKGKLCGFFLNGEKRIVGTVADTLAEVLKEFQRRNPNFLSLFELQSKGHKRQTVARDRNRLFPNDLVRIAKHSLDLGGGWWMGTHIGSVEASKKIRIACDVAGVKFGSELTLIER